MDDPIERRRFARLTVHCPVKLYQPRTRRYRAGCTADFSAGGALIDLAEPTGLMTGERLELAIDPLDHRKLHHADQLQLATVVRAHGEGPAVRQVAIQFDHTSDMPEVQAA